MGHQWSHLIVVTKVSSPGEIVEASLGRGDWCSGRRATKVSVFSNSFSHPDLSKKQPIDSASFYPWRALAHLPQYVLFFSSHPWLRLDIQTHWSPKRPGAATTGLGPPPSSISPPLGTGISERSSRSILTPFSMLFDAADSQVQTMTDLPVPSVSIPAPICRPPIRRAPETDSLCFGHFNTVEEYTERHYTGC